MTRATKAIRLAGALAAVVLLAGCRSTSSRSRSPQAARPASIPPAASGSSTRPTSPTPTASPAGKAAALEVAGVARAFTAAICPYDGRDRLPYGQRLDAALDRWATPGFAAARRWDSARTASAAAGLTEHQSRQACGQVAGGLDPEADTASGLESVRLSVTVTAQAHGSAASTAQETFNLQLVDQAGGWRISSGHW